LLQKPEKLIEKMFAMEFALEVAPLHGIDIIADWQKNNAGARSATDRYRAGSLESCLPRNVPSSDIQLHANTCDGRMVFAWKRRK
jgi:hypothetical protein